MKGPVQSVEISYLSHATEDPDRVAAAVAEVFGGSGTVESERLEGHFGNPILRVRIHLTGADAERAVDRLSAEIPKASKDELLAGLGAHLDEHNALFLRFDKQKLVGGSLEFGESDPVRVKVKPRAFQLKAGPREFYAAILGGR